MSDPGFKRHWRGELARLANGATDMLAENCDWHGSHPWQPATGRDEVAARWADLRRALPDLERRDLLFAAGDRIADPRTPQHAAGTRMIAGIALLQGEMTEDLFGIPATRGIVHLRLTDAHEIAEGKIVRSWMMVDLIDLMRQADMWPLPPSLGAEHQWPAPSRPHDPDAMMQPERGAERFATVMAMHAALLSFDGKSLDSMNHEPYWTERFNWYGPSGVGTTRGLAGFQAHHQIPFLRAFPDRAGSGHYLRIGDGDIAVTGGWPSVTGTHLGAWLGLPPTGRKIEMRVMDFYAFDGPRIAENWVPIDILHMLAQMGVDPLERLAHRRGRPRRTLAD